MGKSKLKSKSKPPAADKELSEADAAAGMMVAERKEKEKPKKRALEEKPLTRKQKRQKLHEKNKWPQHPKITDPAQRERAYLRVAGIEAVSQEQEDETKFPGLAKAEKKALEEDDDEWRHFGRFLGGTDARTRHKAVKRLGQYLQAKSGFGLNGPEVDAVVGLTELDLLKLWKGLWFTLYMADKVPVQDELAKHISKLMWCVAGDQETDEFAAQAYLDMEAQEEMALEEQQQLAGEGDDDEDDDEDVKILSTRRVEREDSDEDDEDDEEEDSHSEESDKDVEEGDEEGGAEEDEEEDEEDPEKTPHIRGAPLAMLMMRTFFRTLLREWGNMDKYRIDKFYTLVRYMVREIYRYMAKRHWSLGIIKLFNDAITEEALLKPPNGVRYHLIDIALEELVVVATKEGAAPVTEAIFLEIMEPYFAMAQHGFGDKTVQARVVEKVLEKFLLEFSVCSGSENKEKVLEEIHVGTISSFIFEMASTEETLDIHRKSLYEMHKTYERQRKKTGTDITLGTSLQKSKEEEDDDEDYATEDMEAEREEETLEQMGFEAEEEEEEEEKAESKESKKDKKKKKKKEKKEQKKKPPKDEEEVVVVGEEPVETPTKPKSERKKATKSKSASKGDMDTTQHGDGEGNTSSKKHKKKKKREKEDSDDGDDGVVTISKAEQKKAKQALEEEKRQFMNSDDEDSDNGKSKKKKKKKKKKKDKDREEEGEGKKKKKTIKRRVSFDNHNRARSWKASMAGLRHLDPSEAISKTPEKSILLNKGKGISKSLSPKSRKRATDYF